jgi:hypothetical protein
MSIEEALYSKTSTLLGHKNIEFDRKRSIWCFCLHAEEMYNNV